KRLRAHDEDMVKAEKEEIDTMLVFAGLFSTVLTAFNVESYSLLQAPPPPTPDPNTQILLQILEQITRVGGNASVAPPPTVQQDNFQPPAVVVWINICWFSSLVLSLSAATIGLLARQW
ncbi:hypothetical protein CERSUDRAFT_26415, partial [Gelatoporia subvermispora B]